MIRIFQLTRIALTAAIVLALTPGLRAQSPAAASADSSESNIAHIKLTPGEDAEVPIVWSGLHRIYLVHVPKKYDAQKNAPLVVMLHGAGGNAQGTMKRYGWPAKSDAEGFVVICPQGTLRSASPENLLTNPRIWNDGSGRGTAGFLDIDDVGYISASIDDISKRLAIDPARIYVTGFSNGASMTWRVGLELSDKVAAIAPVSGHLWNADIKPRVPRSCLFMVGKADPLNPFNGSAAKNAGLRNKPGAKPAMQTHVDRWGEIIHAAAVPTTLLDAHGITAVRYAPAVQAPRENLELIYYVIDGLGHSWPGCDEVLPEKLIGKTTHQIDATDVIWDFFQKHTR